VSKALLILSHQLLQRADRRCPLATQDGFHDRSVVGRIIKVAAAVDVAEQREHPYRGYCLKAVGLRVGGHDTEPPPVEFLEL